ncbi:hypothetical protein [Actinomyces wuliandei]|uniref:hypothetical protein n=1 Tax=Actinomyces wuliandei TaxID=2057743 RepID=UPI00214C71FA|nr:hypothetical protein [Actinomyces wuliandei]
MSTDQTGVSSPTSDETTEGARRAPRSSRRAIRQAERAAEREAILTGQQPLLTRREMRRLREEAKALQAAVEAGEITEEQARALQDPLAEQPVVEDRTQSADSGSGVTSTAPQEEQDPQEQASEADQSLTGAAVAGAQDAFQGDEHPGAGGVPGGGAAEGPGGQSDWFDLAAPATSAASSGAGTGFQPDPQGRQPQGGEPGGPGGPADSGAVPGGAADQAPGAEGSPSWRALTADEAVALSEIPTGLMDAVDLPIVAEGQWSAPEEDSGPAPVPARASLRERLETGQTPMVPGAGAASGGYSGGVGGDGASAPGAQAGASPGGAAAQPASDSAAWQGPSQGGQDGEVSEDGGERYGSYGGYGRPGGYGAGGSSDAGYDAGYGDYEASQGAAGPAGTPARPDPSTRLQGGAEASSVQPTSGGQGQAAGAASAPSSAVRRPIVRIPAAAQGVRTVNASTGELSAVQPVGSDEEAGQQPVGGPFPAADAVTFEDETSVIPADIATDFEDDAPQWPSLRQDASAAEAAAGQPVSPYSLPDQPGSDRAQEAAAGAFTSTEWDTVAAPRSAVALEDSSAQEPSRTGRVLLIALIVLVVVLVVAAVVWFIVSQTGGSSEATGSAALAGRAADASRLL